MADPEEDNAPSGKSWIKFFKNKNFHFAVYFQVYVGIFPSMNNITTVDFRKKFTL